MSDLAVSQKISNSVMEVSFSGKIVDHSEIPRLDLEGIQSLILDLNGIIYINSLGIRLWLLWMWNIEKTFPGLQVCVDRCPSLLIHHIRNIKDFVPKDTKIRSFYVPYYCSSCDDGIEVLCEYDGKTPINEKNISSLLEKDVKCPKCSAKMNLDVNPDQYLALFQQRSPQE